MHNLNPRALYLSQKTSREETNHEKLMFLVYIVCELVYCLKGKYFVGLNFEHTLFMVILTFCACACWVKLFTTPEN